MFSDRTSIEPALNASIATVESRKYSTCTRSKLLVPMPVGIFAAHQLGSRSKVMLRPSSKCVIR